MTASTHGTQTGLSRTSFALLMVVFVAILVLLFVDALLVNFNF